MGTGSVTHLVFTKVFGLPTVPVPFFGRRISSTRGKRGQAPRGYDFSRTSGRYLLGASPHFPLTAYSLSYQREPNSANPRAPTATHLAVLRAGRRGGTGHPAVALVPRAPARAKPLRCYLLGNCLPIGGHRYAGRPARAVVGPHAAKMVLPPRVSDGSAD